MKKALQISLALVFLTAQTTFSQNLKKQPLHPANPAAGQVHQPLRWPHPPGVPRSENPFGLGKIQYSTLPSFSSNLKIQRGEDGLPIAWQGSTTSSKPTPNDARTVGERGLDYLVSLAPERIADPANEFKVVRAETDELGMAHVRLQQIFQGIPVHGAELIAHARDGEFASANGRYFATPNLPSTVPAISAEKAFENLVENLGPANVKLAWTARELTFVGGKNWTAELVIFFQNSTSNEAKLAWNMTVRPDLMHRFEFMVDAQTGAILRKIDNTCSLVPHLENPPLDGPVTANGTDLLGQNRTFGAWQIGSKFYLEDASKSSFNPTKSTMPDDPVGALAILDAFNTSPEVQASFKYDVAQSASKTFSSQAAVSAIYNSNLCFDYYKAKHGRNGIDGNGGNILAFVNVAESDGSGMDNAFWNGDAMWYGNGASLFKPLARGLDVGGHEMTHGVVEKTANLEYQGESGALNESFADIFGAMIDLGDWKIGEDVVKPGVSPNDCLRDMSNPNNNASQGTIFWQPKHVNEKYNGNQDNGGVHINSGIPNRAYYLFATNAAVGTDKAEKVYYRALDKYLIKSSKFVDERIAVLQAANDLYGSAVANAAASAFDAVGILGSAPSGNYLGQLSTNPGQDFVLLTTPDYQRLDLARGDGTVLGTLYDQGLTSRPSISDNGSQIVFVNADKQVVTVDLVYGTQINFTVNPPQGDPIYRNAVIAKDGTFLAVTTDAYDNRLEIYDLLSPAGASRVFFLSNPTYTQGQTTSDVQYCDVMEFDYSGQYLMYDAENAIVSQTGDTLSYWDIGFLHFWENNQFTDGENDIEKLFNGLPDQTSVGDPTFSKNSPYIIAFDFLDGQNDKVDILGANLETGDVNTLVSNNGDQGWPSYNRLDNSLVYDKPNFFSFDIAKRGVDGTKIAGTGSASTFVQNYIWPVWYANGNRSLHVATVEANGSLQFSASPNPVLDLLQVEIPAKTSAPARVEVLNLLGQTLASQNLTLAEGQNRTSLSVGNLPAGQYLVRVSVAGAAGFAKIVKN